LAEGSDAIDRFQIVMPQLGAPLLVIGLVVAFDIISALPVRRLWRAPERAAA
jgi:hypothetical protein